jgi:hypothetical protein
MEEKKAGEPAGQASIANAPAWHALGRWPDRRNRGHELLLNDRRIGTIRPYQHGTGWIIYVEGLPHMRRNAGQFESQVNYIGLARSRNAAQAIIIAAWEEHEACKRGEEKDWHRCSKHGAILNPLLQEHPPWA